MGEQLSPRTRIGEALLQQAAWVHQELEEADSLDMPMPEEAITTFVLKALKRDLDPSIFRLTVYSKQVEGGTTGADWEWWFGDGSGTPYVGMRVQAKKLHSKSGGHRYDFSHTTGESKKLQIDTLRSAAAEVGLPAIYALYNGGFELEEFSWGCCVAPSKPLFGVSMISADTAEKLRKAKTTKLADVGSHSLPWSCLMLCPNWLAGQAVPTPFGEGPGLLLTFAADLIGGLVDADFSRGQSRRDISASSPNDAVASAVRSWDTLPSYVQELVADARVDETAVDDSRFSDDGVPGLPASLGGVAVFSSDR